MPYRESQRRREAPVRLCENASKAPEADVRKGCAHPVADACRDELHGVLRRPHRSDASAVEDGLTTWA
jgi:hypothetical protein